MGKMRRTMVWIGVAAMCLVGAGASAFEIITVEDIRQNIVPVDVFIRTADNFIVLYDASGSMDDAFLEGVKKIDAERDILKQQNDLLPELGYNAGLYLFTPFQTFYEMQPYQRDAFRAAIDKLPDTKTAGGMADQPTPLAEGIAKLDEIIAGLSGKTVVFIFTDGTYSFDKVKKVRPLDAAKALAAKYDVCFYLVSSATTDKAAQLLDDMAGVNECSQVVPFAALYRNPVMGIGPLYVIDSTVEIETITEQKVVGVKADDIHFAFDQAEILPSDHENLDKVAAFLQENPNSYAVLAGFTDNHGDQAYNLKLSRMRVQSAKNYILEKGRIDPDRVVLQWYGATNFIADNSTEEGRRKNRRVEIAIGMLD